MQFLKVGLLFACSTLSRLLSGLVVIKLIAVYIGADGLGQLGQFMSLMTMITMLAGGGISSGIIKYVAGNQDDKEKLAGYIGAASAVTLSMSLVLGAILLLGAPQISAWLFKSEAYAHLVRVLAAAQVALAATNFFLGLVNGHKRVKAFAAVNALGAILGSAGVAAGCIYYGMTGAMYGLIWMPACYILFLLPWYRFGLRMKWSQLRPRWDLKKIREYSHFSLMLLTSVMTVQLSQVIIRKIIEHYDSWTGVGYWQATAKVSDAYLLFITVVLSNYYLPRLAAMRTRDEIGREVALVYRYALPVLAILSLSVYICRDWIILILFSREFMPMRDFFTWQLIGDGFKVAAFIGAYVAVARANTKIYVFAELYQAIMLVALCFMFVGMYGAIGATYAYCLHFAIYFVIVKFVLGRYLRKGGPV